MNNLNTPLKTTDGSRQDFSDYLGVSYTSVTKYCLGINTPKVDNLVTICKYFNISMYQLIGVIPLDEAKTNY